MNRLYGTFVSLGLCECWVHLHNATLYPESCNLATLKSSLYRQSLLSDYIHDHHGGMKQTMSFMVVMLAAAHFLLYAGVFATIGGYTFTQTAAIGKGRKVSSCQHNG